MAPPLDLYDVGMVGVVALEPRNPDVTVNDGSTDGTKSTVDGKDYYKFTSSGDFVVSAVGGEDPVVKVMLIGGGGQGTLKYYGTGAGAGGMFFDDVVVSAQTYSIVIGGSETDSTGFGKTAMKGAHGKSHSDSPAAGGCGCGNKSGGDVSDDYTVGQQPTSTSGGYGYNGGGAEDTTTVANSGGGGGCGGNGTQGVFSDDIGVIPNVVGTGGVGANDTFLENILTNANCGVTVSSVKYIGGGGGACSNLSQLSGYDGTTNIRDGRGGYGGGGDSGLISMDGGDDPQGLCAPNVGSTSSCSCPSPNDSVTLYGPINNTGGGAGASGRYCTTRASGGSGICVVVVG